MKSVSVSTLDQFRRFRDELISEDDLVESITGAFVPTRQILVGREVHELIERAGDSASCELIDAARCMEMIDREDMLGEPECWISGELAGARITARVDALHGVEVREFKSTWSAFNADRYMASYQWRLYLALSQAQRFVYRVFEMAEGDKGLAHIKADHTLTLAPYVGMVEDCENLIREYFAWADSALARGISLDRQKQAV